MELFNFFNNFLYNGILYIKKMADFINANNQIAIPVKFNYALPTNLPSATSREVKVPSINDNNFTIINSTQNF